MLCYLDWWCLEMKIVVDGDYVVGYVGVGGVG